MTNPRDEPDRRIRGVLVRKYRRTGLLRARIRVRNVVENNQLRGRNALAAGKRLAMQMKGNYSL